MAQVRNGFKTKAGTDLPLLNLKGKEYLQVAYRIVWMREEHPEWSIETHLVTAAADMAISKATIKDEAGRIIAMAHKQETKQGFADFIEKSETGAIGRALALCGYGTQFAADELDEGERLADSPLGKTEVHGAYGNGNSMAAKHNQPGPEDGDPGRSQGYLIPFGKFAKRALEDVSEKDLANYVTWLEENSEKTRKPLSAVQSDFIERAGSYLASVENGSQSRGSP